MRRRTTEYTIKTTFFHTINVFYTVLNGKEKEQNNSGDMNESH